MEHCSDFDMERCEYIHFPEILLRGLEYWLATTSRKTRSLDPPMFKLPPLLASSDNQTWLATRKSQKVQKDVLYSEWLSRPQTYENKTLESESRVPSLQQHMPTIQAAVSEAMMETGDETKVKEAKSQNLVDMGEKDLMDSQSTFNDVWLRSNNCAKAVHEYSNLKFMYSNSTTTNTDNTDMWLAGKSSRAEQKRSPKRQKLDLSSVWSEGGDMTASSMSATSSVKQSASPSSCDLTATSINSPRDKLLSYWLKAETTNKSVEHGKAADKMEAEDLGRWRSQEVKPEQLPCSTEDQKKLDIIGWIQDVKSEVKKPFGIEKNVESDEDLWLQKSETRCDPVDSVRAGFLSLQVDDNSAQVLSQIKQEKPCDKASDSQWLSMSSSPSSSKTNAEVPTTSLPMTSTPAISFPPVKLLESAGVGGSSMDSCSWVLCSDTETTAPTTTSGSSSRNSVSEEEMVMDDFVCQ